MCDGPAAGTAASVGLIRKSQRRDQSALRRRIREIAMNRPRCGCLRAICELTGNGEQIIRLENQVANLLHRSIESASHAGRKQR